MSNTSMTNVANEINEQQQIFFVKWINAKIKIRTRIHKQTHTHTCINTTIAIQHMNADIKCRRNISRAPMTEREWSEQEGEQDYLPYTVSINVLELESKMMSRKKMTATITSPTRGASKDSGWKVKYTNTDTTIEYIYYSDRIGRRGKLFPFFSPQFFFWC